MSLRSPHLPADRRIDLPARLIWSFGALLALAACSGSDDPSVLARAGDYGRAAQLWHDRALRGDNDARNALGILCYLGLGRPRDRIRARQWFEQAAKEGHSGAQLNLGMMYRFGHGIPQDLFLAYQWLYAAEAQGNPHAHAYLVSMAGLIVPNKQDRAIQNAVPYILYPVEPVRAPLGRPRERQGAGI